MLSEPVDITTQYYSEPYIFLLNFIEHLGKQYFM